MADEKPKEPTWKELFVEKQERYATRERIEEVYRRMLGQADNVNDALTAVAEQSFNTVFRPILFSLQCSVMINGGPQDLYRSFHEGLFLDFIFFAISELQDLRYGYQKSMIQEGEPLYGRILKAQKEKWLLHERIMPVRVKNPGQRPVKAVEVYTADLQQLEYFYGEESFLAPECRRSNCGDIEKFSFNYMGKSADEAMTEEELWINWYLREKRWGTSLAALASSYSPEVVDTADEICAEIWRRFTEEEQDVNSPDESLPDGGYAEKPVEPLLCTLMKFPFPACRLSYVRTALDSYTALCKKTGVFQLTGYLENVYRLSILRDGKIQTGDDAIVCLPQFIELLQEEALHLTMGSWMYFYAGKDARAMGVPSLNQLMDCLENPEWLKNMQKILCEIAEREAERVFGVKNFLKTRWPLLVSSERCDKHFSELLGQKSLSVCGRSQSAKAFVVAQVRCCRT